MIQFRVHFDLITFDVCLTARVVENWIFKKRKCERDDILVLSARQFTSLLSFMKHISIHITILAEDTYTHREIHEYMHKTIYKNHSCSTLPSETHSYTHSFEM